MTWGAIFLYRICLMNCFEMWIFKGLMLFNWEIWLILKCNLHLNVFYIHICATNRPKLCWDKSWDIDIKIKGKIVGRWYQEFHGVPLEINCVYTKILFNKVKIKRQRIMFYILRFRRFDALVNRGTDVDSHGPRCIPVTVTGGGNVATPRSVR